MWVDRINSVSVSYRKEIEFEAVTYPKVLRARWGTGGMRRGADWQLSIRPSDFAKLAKLMYKLDPDAATTAFAKAPPRKRRPKIDQESSLPPD